MIDEDFRQGLEKFLEDVIDTLSTAESLILRLSTGKSSDVQRKLLQMFHSIKGSAGTFGLREFESSIHKMEDNLNILAAGGLSADESISDLLEQLDYIHHRSEYFQLHPDELIAISNTTIKPEKESLNKKTSAKITPVQNMHQGKKILILGDSKVTSTLLLKCLNPYDVACSLVEDGHSALGRLLLEPFDVIITPDQLKLIDGINLAKMLKLSDNPNTNTPIIFISSVDNKEALPAPEANWFWLDKNPSLPILLIKQLQSLIKLEKKENVPAFVTNLNTIALIDDRENIHSIIDICFTNDKTKIIHIVNPISELHRLKEQNLDVILLDYKLGETTGIQILKQIRQMGILTPVIFLTYTTDAELIANLLKQDVAGLIRKPFSPKKLPQQIMELLSLYNKKVS